MNLGIREKFWVLLKLETFYKTCKMPLLIPLKTKSKEGKKEDRNFLHLLGTDQ